MNDIDKNSVLKYIKSCSDENELRGLHNAIRNSFKAVEQKKVNSFNIGDNVSFVMKSGKILGGEVVKVNRRTIQIDSGVDGLWNVHPSFVRK